ncbi:hypothetical protein A3A39_01825 [Candidatus Kaiserbacteria bacterium RIFCSPLOWO2_01_FULL_54_13]|uniref:Uncharacterized protein n=1 Tax=Candidatus Kaiserbacteria bacterium RIFCSPLOWO2_01_FULL_54_13 TaxID=1798512 RepID=A0A1F6F0A3_9BACT|nr:MAG: hypothetical protein A3A39_01825 [Candidatus Kaiserbacteria bacterium RIFCSPLOWO2_01_FULL_54_13]
MNNRYAREFSFIAEAVKTGVAAGAGHAFWEAMGHEPFGWELYRHLLTPSPDRLARFRTAVKDFAVTEMFGREPASFVTSMEVGLETLAKALRTSATCQFDKRMWGELAQSADLFADALAFSHINYPYFVNMPVPYDGAPPTVPYSGCERLLEQLKLETPRRKIGGVSASLFELRKDNVSVEEIEDEMGHLGYRLGGAHELAAFGRFTSVLSRPWPILRREVIAPATTVIEADHVMFFTIDPSNGSMALSSNLHFLHGRGARSRRFGKGEILLGVRDIS